MRTTENEGLPDWSISIERVTLGERDGRTYGEGKLELMEDINECQQPVWSSAGNSHMRNT